MPLDKRQRYPYGKGGLKDKDEPYTIIFCPIHSYTIIMIFTLDK